MKEKIVTELANTYPVTKASLPITEECGRIEINIIVEPEQTVSSPAVSERDLQTSETDECEMKENALYGPNKMDKLNSKDDSNIIDEMDIKKEPESEMDEPNEDVSNGEDNINNTEECDVKKEPENELSEPNDIAESEEEDARNISMDEKSVRKERECGMGEPNVMNELSREDNTNVIKNCDVMKERKSVIDNLNEIDELNGKDSTNSIGCVVMKEAENEVDQQYCTGLDDLQEEDRKNIIGECDIKIEPECDDEEMHIGKSSTGNSELADGRKTSDGDPGFVLDYTSKPVPEYRITIDSSDTSDSSSDSSSDDESDSTALDADVSEEENHEIIDEEKIVPSGPKKKPSTIIKTKGEVLPEDLPPLEELQITLDDSTEMLELGKVSGIVGVLVIIQSGIDKPALNEDSVIFLHDRKVMGLVFEIFGPVARPYYSVRFNSVKDIEAKVIEIGTTVLFAPKEDDYTHYVFVKQLMQMRGSDASWEDNNEPPDKHLDYSDDEQERQARKARKGGGDNNEEDSQKKRRKRKVAEKISSYQDYTDYNQQDERESNTTSSDYSRGMHNKPFVNRQFKWPPQERPSLRGRGSYNRFNQSRNMMTPGSTPRHMNGHQNRFQSIINESRRPFYQVLDNQTLTFSQNQNNQGGVLNPPTFVHQLQSSPPQYIDSSTTHQQQAYQSRPEQTPMTFDHQGSTQSLFKSPTVQYPLHTNRNTSQPLQSQNATGVTHFGRNLNNQAVQLNSQPIRNFQDQSQTALNRPAFQGPPKDINLSQQLSQNNNNRTLHQNMNNQQGLSYSYPQNDNNRPGVLSTTSSAFSFGQQIVSPPGQAPPVYRFSGQQNAVGQRGSSSSSFSNRLEHHPLTYHDGNNRFQFGANNFGRLSNSGVRSNQNRHDFSDVNRNRFPSPSSQNMR